MSNKVEKGVLPRIRANFINLSASEKRVAEYITIEPEQIIHMTLAEIAAKLNVSDASVLRFIRSIGFQGFYDLKMALVADSVRPGSGIFEEIKDDDDIPTIAEKIVNEEINILKDTLLILDYNKLTEAIKLLGSATRIIIFGVGASAYLAMDFQNRIFRLGYNVMTVTDAYLQVLYSPLFEKSDVLFLISRSGESGSLHDAACMVRKNKVKVITLTCNERSTLAKLSDISITASSREIRRETVASNVGLLSVIEILYIELAMRNREKTLKNEQAIWQANINIGDIFKSARSSNRNDSTQYHNTKRRKK